MMKLFLTSVFLAVFLSVSLYAQKTIVPVPSDDGSEGNLNQAVQEAIDAGTLSNTVFELEPNGYYILIDTIFVPQGEHLEIVAPEPGTTQETAPPQIVWSANVELFNQRITIHCFGDLTLKNVWMRYANTAGEKNNSCILFEDDPDANASGKGEIGVFEGVLFDYSQCPYNGIETDKGAGGAVTVVCQKFKGTFRNCYFRNCADEHFRYYGRALSFPYASSGWHIDSVLFENCTFANMGYVYMQEGGEYGDNVHFNHCTFLNVMMFSLESGWWYKMSVTNSLWINAFMYGDDPNDEGDQYGGTLWIDPVEDFGFYVPFTDQERRILFTHSSYFIEDWLTEWMTDNFQFQPQPMLNPPTLEFFDSIIAGTGEKIFPYMNRTRLLNGVDPDLLVPATNMEDIKTFLYKKWTDNTDIDWAYEPDAGWQQTWPLPEDLSYVNETIKTAAMAKFPLGDLYHWWPEEYAAWKTQAEDEYTTIFNWLENGVTYCIDIKPGSDPNSINCRNEKGIIPVAILTTEELDATTVDHTTVTFEGATEVHVNKKTGETQRHEEDVDNDGDLDLVFHFRFGDTQLNCESTEATLLGKTFDGQPIIATNQVRMVDGSSHKLAKDMGGNLPDKNSLFDNYPNPFNPYTIIRYELSSRQLVRLKIYDLLGKEVAELVNKTQEAGVYEITFNASDLPSGVYIYRIIAGEFNQTRKMVVMK